MNDTINDAKIEVLFYRSMLEDEEQREGHLKSTANIEELARAKKEVNRLRKKLIASLQKMEDLMAEPIEPRQSNRYRSPFIGNVFTVLQNGQVVFDGGVSFSQDEVKLLEGKGQEAVLSLYRVKEVFGNAAQLLCFRDVQTAV